MTRAGVAMVEKSGFRNGRSSAANGVRVSPVPAAGISLPADTAEWEKSSPGTPSASSTRAPRMAPAVWAPQEWPTTAMRSRSTRVSRPAWARRSPRLSRIAWKYFAALRRISRLLQLADFLAQSGVLRLHWCRRLGRHLGPASPRLARRDRVRLELRRTVLHDHEMSIVRSSGSSVPCVQDQGSRPRGRFAQAAWRYRFPVVEIGDEGTWEPLAEPNQRSALSSIAGQRSMTMSRPAARVRS